MKMGMYVIRDKLAEESSAPMLCKNHAVAIVAYHNALARLTYDAEPDYALYHVGMMDTETTTFEIFSSAMEMDTSKPSREKAEAEIEEVKKNERAL